MVLSTLCYLNVIGSSLLYLKYVIYKHSKMYTTFYIQLNMKVYHVYNVKCKKCTQN